MKKHKDHTATVNRFLVLLDQFIESKQRNKWIQIAGLKIYVRQSYRNHNQVAIQCLDLASIEATDKGNGLFTAILDAILRKYTNYNIFVESILQQRFYDFLIRQGFEPYPVDSHSVIKLCKH